MHVYPSHRTSVALLPLRQMLKCTHELHKLTHMHPINVLHRQSTTTTFLDLPRELRDIIYELSLVSATPIDVFRLAGQPDSCKLRISSTLLRVSRQVYDEAMDTLYGLNTFQATILLDPRVPHQLDRLGCSSARPFASNNFTHPMIKRVRRLVIQLKFYPLSQWPDQDVLFPEAMLKAFILGGSPDLVIVKPDCCASYLDTMQQSNTMLAVANTALAVSRGTLFTSYLLSYLSDAPLGHRSTLAVCHPPNPASFDFLEFPWIRSMAYPISDNIDVIYRIPRRFSSTGQLGLDVGK